MEQASVHHGKVFWPVYIARSTPTNVPKNAGEHTDRLNQLVSKAGRMLLKIKGTFPFDFFPDTLIVDEYQVNLINRIFFWSEQIRSIPIKDITDVTLQTSLFFSSLHIYTNGPSDFPLIIAYLKKKEAAEAKSLVQGLREAYKENIDIGYIDNLEEVKQKIEFIGEGNTLNN